METKPTSFARGVPAEERNGFYGIEDDLIAGAGGQQLVAVVTYSVDEVVSKAIAGEQYPVVKATHIEVLHDEKAVAAALKLRDAAYKKRTGENALDLPEVDE
ncbi:hypothetical protein ACFVR6_03855 [Microbacterium sp. NPDC058021]|uniref:hypothetical protein n=1 Tax=Microbacterium sp. NPDC058021 TaxID=3346306 RepID=UPI0036DE7039